MDKRSAVNPAYLTAKSTLPMLAGAGSDDAKRMIGALGTQDDHIRNRDQKSGGSSPLSEADGKAIMVGVTLSVEARFAAVSRLIRTEGYTNLLDIACGYTPRAIYCDREGIDYVGLDVPVVAEELNKAVPNLRIGHDHPVYVGGDATNAASLTAAADLLDGELLISCEGLFPYLSEDEATQLIAGVREILLRHGGAWATSDMGVNYESFATAAMSSPDAVELYNMARRQTVGSSTIFNEGVSFESEDYKRSLFERGGLKVEKLPFYHGDEDLAMLKQVPEAWREAFVRLLDGCSVWKMTVDESFEPKEVIEGAKQVDNLEVHYALRGDTLDCQVSGRIDTISAPALLEVFEDNFDQVARIEVDATSLEYISSAGLRVLMVATKRLGMGNVEVQHVNNAVREIFESTGFDQMIEVS